MVVGDQGKRWCEVSMCVCVCVYREMENGLYIYKG